MSVVQVCRRSPTQLFCISSANTYVCNAFLLYLCVRCSQPIQCIFCKFLSSVRLLPSHLNKNFPTASLVFHNHSQTYAHCMHARSTKQSATLFCEVSTGHRDTSIHPFIVTLCPTSVRVASGWAAPMIRPHGPVCPCHFLLTDPRTNSGPTAPPPLRSRWAEPAQQRRCMASGMGTGEIQRAAEEEQDQSRPKQRGTAAGPMAARSGPPQYVKESMEREYATERRERSEKDGSIRDAVGTP